MMKRRAFTLIELLVVIAIIAALATLAVVGLNRVRAQARDTARKAELNQLVKGMELYRESYGVYPCGKFDWSYNGVRYSRDRTYEGDDGDACLADPLANMPGFLNGAAATLDDQYCRGEPKTGGLFQENIISSACLDDPIGSTTDGYEDGTYRSYTLSEDRQLYIIETWLETDRWTMENDGGCCKAAYEVGTGVGKIPSDCSNASTEGGDFTCPLLQHPWET